jgi:hypothetical protein
MSYFAQKRANNLVEAWLSIPITRKQYIKLSLKYLPELVFSVNYYLYGKYISPSLSNL